MLSCDVKDISMPVDSYLLCDIGHVHFDVDEVDGIVIGDVWCFKVFDELVDDRSAVE